MWLYWFLFIWTLWIWCSSGLGRIRSFRIALLERLFLRTSRTVSGGRIVSMSWKIWIERRWCRWMVIILQVTFLRNGSCWASRPTTDICWTSMWARARTHRWDIIHGRGLRCFGLRAILEFVNVSRAVIVDLRALPSQIVALQVDVSQVYSETRSGRTEGGEPTQRSQNPCSTATEPHRQELQRRSLPPTLTSEKSISHFTTQQQN